MKKGEEEFGQGKGKEEEGKTEEMSKVEQSSEKTLKFCWKLG